MLEGPIGGGETMMMAGVAPPRFEARPPNPNSFTPLEGKKFYKNHVHPPVFEQPTMMGPSKFEEPDIASSGGYSPPTDTEIPKELRKLLTDMQSGGKKPEQKIDSQNNQPVVDFVNKADITEEQKSFLTKVWDSIRKFFPWNWNKKN